MSVYVSEMRVSLKNKNWPYSHHCYLVADTIAELHQFAIRLGLLKSWFQNKTIPHYDLTVGMRAGAIRSGATKIDDKTLFEFIKKQRIKET